MIEQIPPKNGLSRLETLPVELIEKIFLHSLEINLPRASPSLAAALSSERIYRVLILLSFWDDDNIWGRYGAPIPDPVLKMFRPLEYRRLETPERSTLQAAILNSRWCTLDRVKGQLPNLLRLTLQRYWSDSWITMEEADKIRLNHKLDNLNKPRLISTFQGVDSDGNRHELEIDSPFVLYDAVMDWRGNPDAECDWTYRTTSALHIPNRLLHGKPWTDEKLSFLELLRNAYGNNDQNTGLTFSFSKVQEGIHDAIVEQNARALCNLLELDEYFSRWNNGKALKRGFYEIPAEHFRSAVRYSGHKEKFLALLMRGNAESIPYDDPEITAWAMQARDRGSYFGEWLLEFMLLLPGLLKRASSSASVRGGPPIIPTLFADGSLNSSHPMADPIPAAFGHSNTWQEELRMHGGFPATHF